MAKAKSGGTRSFLRGRVGSDVYSIGKDAKGNKQQIVRSLAESVANPQTLSQMRGRMIMSTIMQAVSSMAAIIDHSFDNVPAGQPNVSEFIRRNYALVKADVAAHPTSGNSFGLNKYGEKGIKQGAYVVAAGSAIDLAGATLNGASKTITIALSAGATIADLRSALGIGVEDYFTAVCITADGKFLYNRFHVSQALASATEISASNINDVITLDGNVAVTLAFANNTITATFADFSANAGIIVSRKENATYKHNDVVLAAPSAPVYTSDDALPTYPTGTQRFLNGGGEEVAPFSPEPAPTPTPGEPITVTGWKINGETKSGADARVEVDSYGNINVTANASGSIGTDTYKLMKNSSKSVTGATLIQSISAFPVSATNVAYPSDMYVMVVKNDTEIVGACEVYGLGQD
jgi:hypothetical protein